MRTRSQTRNHNRQQQAPPAVVEPFNLVEPFDNPSLVPMADNRTMAELLQAPTEGYEDAIVIPEINANFELKHGLINLVQNKQFFGHDKEDLHAHIRYFNKITSTMRFPDIPSTSIKLMLFPFSLEELFRSGVAYKGPTIPTTPSSLPKVVEREAEVTKDTALPTNNGSTKDVQPPVVHVENHVPISEPVVAPVSALIPNQSLIPYPSRRNEERHCEKSDNQTNKFNEIFKDLSFKISFTDALILMPKFALTLKALIGNKEKLSEMARTPLNEHCSAVILNKLPEKLGDPDKFLIPCEFPKMDECLALADLGASINLMPLSVWKKLSLPKLTPTCMTLELADRSISRPIGIAEDVPIKVGTGRALIDMYKGELTLRVRNKAITFNLDQTSRYSANYNDMTANRIDIIKMACEEYSQEVLGFSNVIASCNPTPYYDPIVFYASPTLASFEDSDFILEEVDAFLSLEDDPTSPEVDHLYYDPNGDILLLETLLNSDPSPPPPNQGNYLPKIQKELKICKAKNEKSSIDEPPMVELKDLPPHLEYAFLEGDDKTSCRS
ncbi:reverse transcriptase domain-containing protein [Tanacetum coccineum]